MDREQYDLNFHLFVSEYMPEGKHESAEFTSRLHHLLQLHAMVVLNPVYELAAHRIAQTPKSFLWPGDGSDPSAQ
jgi:hypothetical protein